MVQCPSGICESETATFSQPLTVPEQLVCPGVGAATFDTTPYPPTAGANIKALHASWNARPYVLTDPVISISGNQIGIAQTGSYSGPTPPPTLYCISTSASLGVLPAGHYDLTWQLTTPNKVEIYHHSLDVLNSPSIPTLQWPSLLFLALALTAMSISALRR
jgi:hypothetical protein